MMGLGEVARSILGAATAAGDPVRTPAVDEGERIRALAFHVPQYQRLPRRVAYAATSSNSARRTVSGPTPNCSATFRRPTAPAI